MKRLTTNNLELRKCLYCEEQNECYSKGWCSAVRKAIIELARYEKTGLIPGQIRELKERDTAKEAIITGYNRAIGCKVGKCPKCGGMTRDISEFCDECGQRLKWED